MRRFFDTNVLVYAHSRDAPAKRELAHAFIEEAIAQDGFVLSTQVLAEFFSTVVRRKDMGPMQARELVRLWSEHDVVPHTAELVLRSISLHLEHAVSFWDALILQAALDSHCDVLLSEDLQHGRRFGNLEVRNPFVSGEAHEPMARRYGVSARARMPVDRSGIRRKTKGRRVRPAS